MNIFRQLRSILPGAKHTQAEDEGPCACELFVASRLKRQGSAHPFPRQNDPQPSADTHFGAQLLRLAAERADHPPAAAPSSLAPQTR